MGRPAADASLFRRHVDHCLDRASLVSLDGPAPLSAFSAWRLQMVPLCPPLYLCLGSTLTSWCFHGKRFTDPASSQLWKTILRQFRTSEMWGWIRMCLSFFFNKNLNSSILLFKSDGTVLLFRKKKKRASCTLFSFLFCLFTKWTLKVAGSLVPLSQLGSSPQCLPWVPTPHPPSATSCSPFPSQEGVHSVNGRLCLKLTRSPLASDSILWHEVFSSVAVHSHGYWLSSVALSSILSWFPRHLSFLDIFFFPVTFSGDLPSIHIDVPTLQPKVTPSPWKRLSLDVAPLPIH